MNIEQIAREAGDDWDSTQQRDKDFLDRFAALYRKALIAELVAGSGEQYAWGDLGSNWCSRTRRKDFVNPFPLYTADQLAGAVLRERKRCCDALLNKCHDFMTREEEAAVIRSGA